VTKYRILQHMHRSSKRSQRYARVNNNNSILQSTISQNTSYTKWYWSQQ